MKKVNFFAVMIVALFATMGTLVAQEKYAIIIGGNVNPDESIIPSTEQWNGGAGVPNEDFDEIWNDAYLAWEMLITENKPFGKGYDVDNVHVLFGGEPVQDYTFPEQDNRYKAVYNGYNNVVDENANESTIANRFTALASTITEDDFLFVWIMGHGGSDATGHYFYSYDNQKVYDSELAGWLDGIDAHKKTVFLSFPKSGGFAPVLEEDGTVVITACGASEGASRADDLAPGGALIEENEVRNNITYNHGEVNYHLTSALTGFTPLEDAQYNGENLSLADSWIVDGVIMMHELQQWVNNKETALENILYINPTYIWLFTDTSLEYPTLLFWEIFDGSEFEAKGLIAITTGFILSDNAKLTFKDNAKVYFTASIPDIWFVTGSELIIEDHVSFISLVPMYSFFCYSDNIIIGDVLTISAPSYNPGSYFYFENENEILTLNTIHSYNSNVTFQVKQVNIYNSLFTGSACSILAETSFIDSTFFASSYVNFEDNEVCRINTCNFVNASLPSNPGMYINNCDAYSIHNCFVTGYPAEGIWISNSGFGAQAPKIMNNTIFNNGTANGVQSGVRLYNSRAVLSQNNIHGSDIGIESLNNSEVSIIGNKGATHVNETQQIHDNSINQIYATSGAFPFEVEWNAIFDEDNDCLIKYIPNPSGIEINLDVTNNYWGVNFNASTDLCPNGSYTYAPIWSLQTLKSGNGSEAKALFYASQVYADSGLFAQAESGYQQLLLNYPLSSYATASLKELFVIEQSLGNDYASLKAYYATIANQHPNTELDKAADFLSNQCDIEMGNYSTAIAWYEAVIQTPPTYPDSLFAIIDLGNLYIKMENDSLKSAPIGSMAEYKPQSKKQYTVYRDYLLSLLHKSADEENVPEMELNDEKTIKLLPNTPNPFIRSTSLRYIMKEEAYVEIEIFDYTGRHIKTLNEGLKKVGQHNVAFVAESMNPGIYFCTIRCNGKITDTQKITLIK